ncbi:MAG: circadian clock protein KaiC [Armatimonadota bacterium]
MPDQSNHPVTEAPALHKCPTGIPGLDEITFGGLPAGRPTLVCGGAGCGKTLLAMEFLVRGAMEYNEPGVFIAFEEMPEELAQNVASLGFDLPDLEAKGLLSLDYIRVERNEIEETGEYDLEGLFLRLGYAIDSIGAKRIAIDTIETLFAGLTNHGILRAELKRLFRWLKDKGITAIITGEQGEGTLTRHGLEEYVSDCVIKLDNRVTEQMSTRRLRIVKYRGSMHGANEYPFLITQTGFSVLPITSVGLTHTVLEERVSSGVADLDEMLGGAGYYRGSSVLISGTAGIGKTSMAAAFVDATCRRGERCLYLAYEESPDQLMRNMRSIGIDLAPWVAQGLLRIEATRPTMFGLEMHLAMIHDLVRAYQPHAVVIDPITSFLAIGSSNESKAMLMRLVDFLKLEQITGLFTNLTSGGSSPEHSDVAISSVIDTWLLLRDIELGGERNRGMYILKSRGMAHSNQIREFLLGPDGIRLVDVYLGTGGVLTGSARVAQETQERTEAMGRHQETERRQFALERKRHVLDAQIAALQADFAAEEEEFKRMVSQDTERLGTFKDARQAMARSRRTDDSSGA